MIDMNQVNVIDMREAIARAALPPAPIPFVPPPPTPPAATAPTWIAADELCGMHFAPIKYVVPGYIAEGLTILAGKPKLGKSWLCMEVGLAVAAGSNCLGDIKCEQGSVLYLALEDNRRRLQSRIQKVWMLESLSGQPVPSKLHLAVEWPRANEGGLQAIRDWISKHPDARLVVIDVFAQFKSVSKGKDASLYQEDYGSVKELQALAMQTGVAVILVHHTRKSGAESDAFEKVSGTLGLSGAADSVLILDRDQNGTTLYQRGRDIAEFNHAVQFDSSLCRWKAIGNADDCRRTDERSVILDLLRESNGPMSPGEIAAVLGLPGTNVRQLLYKMSKSGEIIKVGRGNYAAPVASEHVGDKPPFAMGDADDE